MKARIKEIGLVVFFLLFTFISCSRKPETSCIFGDKIPQQVLEQIIPLGNRIMMGIESGDFDQIYQLASQDMKESQTKEQFKTLMKGILQNFSPLEYSRLGEAYYLTNQVKGNPEAVNVACDLTGKGALDIYQAPPNSELVSLIFYSKSGQETVQTLIELIKEADGWRLFSISITPRTLRKRTVDYYIREARREREKGRLRLALLYYQIAYLLSNLSPNINEFVSRSVLAEMSQLKTDYFPMGQPEVWKIDDTRYRVLEVGVFLAQGEPWVKVSWVAESLEDTEKLNELSQKLLDFVVRNFPEYQDFFVGVVVEAFSQDPLYAKQSYRQFRRFPEKK